MRQPLYLALALFVGIGYAHAATPDAGTHRPRLVILDVEITGDLGGPEFVAQHDARMKMASARLRENVSRTGLYSVVDFTPAQDLLDQLGSQYRYLHDCNGCDLDVGRQLQADQVWVAWVNRVSGLILTLTYEIHDVATGQIVASKTFGFRGDNDLAWTRAIDYLVRDNQQSSQENTNEWAQYVMTWASELSGYPLPDRQPEVQWKSAAWFSHRVCEDHVPCPIFGLYEDADIVFLREDLTDSAKDHVAVHEFVHYLQHRSGRFDLKSCLDSDKREQEAFRVQSRFVAEVQSGFTQFLFHHPACKPES